MNVNTITNQDYDKLLKITKSIDPSLYIDIAHDALLSEKDFESVLKKVKGYVFDYKTVNIYDTTAGRCTNFCTHCGEEKSANYFEIQRRQGTIYLGNVCRTCRNSTRRAWYQNNKERLQERQKRYRAANPERTHETTMRSRRNNIDSYRAYQKKYNERKKEEKKHLNLEYREKNKEEIRRKRAIYTEKNREKIREWTKNYGIEYRKKNKERIAVVKKNNYLKNKNEKLQKRI